MSEIINGQYQGTMFQCLSAQYSMEYSVKVQDAIGEGFDTAGFKMRPLNFTFEALDIVLDGSTLRFRYRDRTAPEEVYLATLYSSDGILFRGTAVTGDYTHDLELTHFRVGDMSALHMFHGVWFDADQRGMFWLRCREVKNVEQANTWENSHE